MPYSCGLAIIRVWSVQLLACISINRAAFAAASFRMSPMMKKLVSIGLAAIVAIGAMSVTSSDAEARRGRGIGLGVAAGVIGLGIHGAAAAANAGPRYYYGPSRGGCYPGPRECGYTGRSCFYSRYGDYVCRGGNYVCRRPTICD